MAVETALVFKRMGKPSSVVIGYQYRFHGKNSKVVSWVSVEDKCGKCKVKMKTNLQYETLSKTDHSFVPNLAGILVRVQMDNCITEPVHTINKDECHLRESVRHGN